MLHVLLGSLTLNIIKLLEVCISFKEYSIYEYDLRRAKALEWSKYILFNFGVFFLYVCNIYYSLAVALSF